MATPDIRLVVGVDTGLSYSSMRDGINEVIQRIEKENPPKIKIQFDDTEINKKIQSLRSQITEISNQKVSIGATGELQSTLTTISSSLENLSQKIAGIGDSANFNNLADSLKSITPVIENLKSELASLQSATQSFQGINLNIGFGGGNAVTRNAQYGKSARQTVSELKEQARALEEVFKQYTRISDGFPSVMKALQGTNVLQGKDIFQMANNMGDPKLALSKQMDAWKEYIALMQEVARVKGIDITPVTSSFTKGANELVESTQKILTGESELESGAEKLKSIFGSGINSEALNAQLTTINDSINRVSSSIANLKLDGNSLNSFVESVNKLSGSIENLISTIDSVTNRNTSMSDGITSVARAAQKASASLGEYTVKLDESNRKILSDNLSLEHSKIDDFVRRLADLKISAQAVKARWEETAEAGQRLTRVIIDGTNAQNDAVKHTIEFDKKTGEISKEYTEVVHKAKAVKEEIRGAGDASAKSKNETKETKANLEAIDGLIKSIEKTNSSLNSSKNKVTDALGGLSSTGQNKAELEEINKKFDELMIATERLKAERLTANQEDVDGLRRIQEELDALIRKSQERLALEAEANKQPKSAKVIDFSIDTQKVEASLETIRRRLGDLKEPSDEARQSVSDLESAFQKFQSATNQDDKKRALEDVNKLIAVANKRLTEQEAIQRKVTQESKRREQEAKRADNAEKQAATQKEQALKRALALLKQIEQAEANWTAAKSGKSKREYNNLSTYATDLRRYISELESGKITTEDFILKMNQLGISFQGTGSIIRANGEAVKSFGERVKNLGEKFSTWFGVSRIIMTVYSTMRKMVSASVELDAAITQLQIVTKESDQVMSQFGDTAAESAKRIGTSVTDFVSSATTFARLGYSLNESSQLAEFTAMLQNVGDIDVSQAQDAITSIVKAFDVDVDQIESVMDKLVATGNGFPISVSQIAEGMTNASSALSAAGNNFDQSVALLTAANTAVQNAAKASTGLRTIAARIRKTKTELDDLGEVMTEADYDKLVQQLTDFNVSLTDINGEYRSTYDIMQDIAAKWSDMSSMEQAALAEALSGNRQQQIFYSIITNFQEASGAMDAMASSSGTLKEAYGTFMNSTTAHINQFKASFQEFSANLFNSNLLKFFIDIGTAIVNLMNSLQKIHMLLPSIVGIAVTIKGIKLAKSLADSAAKVQTLTAVTLKEKAVTDSLAQSVSLLTLKEKEMLATNINNAVASGALTQEEGSQILATLGLAAADGTLTVANKTLAGSFKTLMASIPVWGWIALGISTVIEIVTALSSVVSSTGQSVEDRLNSANEALKQTQSEVQQLANEYSDLKKQSEEVIPRFTELAKGVNEFGDNVSLTDEEYKEFLELNNKIAEMFPELNLGMDSTGNAMLSLSYSADTLSDSLYGLVEAQRQAAYAAQAEKMPDILSGISSIEEEYKKQIEKAKEVKSEWQKVYKDIENQTLDTNVGRYSTLSQGEQAAREMIKKASELGVHGEALVDDQSDINEGYVFTIKWDYESVDLQDAQRLMEEKVAGQERLIDDYEKRISAKWKELNPAINGWLQTDYIFNDLDSSMQDIAKAMVSGLDFKSLGLKTKDDITDYITENILDPLFLASDDTKEAFKKIFDWKEQLKNGEITAEEFSNNVRGCFDSLKKSIPADQIDGFSEKFVAGFNAMGFAGDDFDSVVQSIIQSWSKLPDSNDEKSKTLTNLSDVATKLKSSYDLIATAEKEMNEEGGVSASTIKALADATDNYMDYLYEENGIIKLNTKAWAEYSNRDMRESISALEEEQKALYRNKKEIEERIDRVKMSGMSEDEISESVANYNQMLEENNAKIIENQAKLDLYNGVFASITDSFNVFKDAYSSAIEGFTDVSNIINNVADSLTTVADLQETVANGFTLSLEKALEFAKVYPEILDSASVAADGQIQLNENIVNAFIESKQAELKAEIDTKINKLKQDKEVLVAKKEFAEGQLKIAKSVGEGEGKITAELAEYKVNASNDVQKILIEAGVDEVKANKLANAAMSNNIEEFDRVALEVCRDMDGNFSEAAYSAAKSIFQNVTEGKKDFASLTLQVHEAAKAIAAVASGQIAGDASIKSGSNGGTKTNSYNLKMTSGTYNGVDYSYTPKTISIDKFISDIKLDISSFDKAIQQIDGQITALEALKSIPLDHFSTSYKEQQKAAEKKSGSSSKEETWFDRAYKDHKHRVAMEQEAESDYLDWLNSAYKKAYNEGIIDLDAYYKYEEEVYNGRKKLAGDAENWFEKEYKAHQHYLKMEEETEADYLKWLDSAYKKAFDQGLIKLEDYRKYREEVYNGLKNLASTADSAIKELVNIRLNMLKDEIEREKEALNTKLSNLKDFYQKQKDMLQESYDNEKYLEEQAEKRKNVADIQAEIDQLRFDDSAKAQKRRIELEKELKDANKTLNDFEKEHTLKTTQDQYDKMYEQQEKTLTEQSAAKLYEKALNDIRTGSVKLYNDMIKWNKEYGDGISDTITKAWENAYKAEKNYYDYTGQHYNGVNLANATGYKKPTRSGYASGTSYATAGIHRVDERGIETIFQSADGQRYRMFSSGEKVLNASASDFLYKFANKGREILDKLFSNASHSYNNVSPGVVANNIQQGNIIIQGNADKTTVSEIRRAQRENLEQMLKQLNRLK